MSACLCNGIGVQDEQFACKVDSECASPNVCVAGVCAKTRPDAGAPDAGFDAGEPDAGPEDAGAPDAGAPDAGEPDAGPPDAGRVDAGLPDGGPDPCGTTVDSSFGADGGARPVFCAIHKHLIIDGDLGDWAGVPFFPLNQRTAASVLGDGMFTADASVDDADSSAVIALQWDQQYLYVAAAMTDDVRALHPPPADYFQDDCFQLYLDGNHDRAVTFDADDLDLLVRADNAAEQYDLANGMDIPGAPAGTLSATRDAGTGANWNIELAIPWTRLGMLAPAPHRKIGIDIIVDDDDDLMMAVRKHYLILFQNSTEMGCAEPYCSTTSFGDAVLTGQPP